MMKPIKFHRCGAHLPVIDLKKTIDYYRDTLGFSDEWTWPGKDGEETDGGIRRDDMLLLFGTDPEHVNAINNDKHRFNLLWFVDSIDAIFEEFSNKNMEMVNSPTDHPYGLREFAFIDINGYYIRVAENIEEG